MYFRSEMANVRCIFDTCAFSMLRIINKTKLNAIHYYWMIVQNWLELDEILYLYIFMYKSKT